MEISAKELRIGNLVNYIDQNSYVQGYIHSISETKVVVHHKYNAWNGKNTVSKSCKIKNIEPIPLTEEWLLKFGFKQWGDKYTFGLKGINIHHRQRGFVLRKSVPVIQYVHTLQNLYFALTGNELEFKQQ